MKIKKAILKLEIKLLLLIKEEMKFWKGVELKNKMWSVRIIKKYRAEVDREGG